MRLRRDPSNANGSVTMPTVSAPNFLASEAITGAGAVVLHDVPPGSVVVGVPARVVRQTPDENKEDPT